MKPLLITLIWCFAGAIVCIWLMLLSGCVQIIHERPDGTRLKINTLFKSVVSKGFYYDPNGFMQVDDYEGIPSDLEFKYNPYTGVKLKTTKGD